MHVSVHTVMRNEYITPTTVEPFECTIMVHATTENKEMNISNVDLKESMQNSLFFVFV